MSPYVKANGTAASTDASSTSVRSERPDSRASTSSPTPARANRTPAPSSGGVSPRPTLIATQVLDQMATSSAYIDHRETRLIEPTTLAVEPRYSDATMSSDLDRAVQTVVRRCPDIQPDEDVVVVTDEPLQDLGERLRTAAQQAGADAVLAVMSPRATDGSPPPRPPRHAPARARRLGPSCAGPRGARGVGRLHRPREPVAESHARAQAR